MSACVHFMHQVIKIALTEQCIIIKSAHKSPTQDWKPVFFFTKLLVGGNLLLKMIFGPRWAWSQMREGGDSHQGRSQMKGTWKNCPLRPKMPPTAKFGVLSIKYSNLMQFCATELSKLREKWGKIFEILGTKLSEQLEGTDWSKSGDGGRLGDPPGKTLEAWYYKIIAL